ncbi:MAG: glycerophosphodiester phosphodiesterase family protein [Paracoccaceae bacterium]
MPEARRLPPAFLSRPLAHRGLHWLGTGAAENSRAAMLAACNAGYGIELDVQMSRDGEAMVFHDNDLDRLTAESGPVNEHMAADLGRIALKGGIGTIPTLAEILGLVEGRTPLLIELKDQDGGLGRDVGRMERRVADILSDYEGQVACMSFNPHTVAAVRDAAPALPLGLVTGPFAAEHWSNVPPPRLAELRGMPDLRRVGAAFISHHHRDLAARPVAAAKAAGLDVLCWTVRSRQEEAAARLVADNITFEGFMPVT